MIVAVLTLSMCASASVPYPQDRILSLNLGAGVWAGGNDTVVYAPDFGLGVEYSIPMFFENIRFLAKLDVSPLPMLRPEQTWHRVDEYPVPAESYEYKASTIAGVRFTFAIVPEIHFRRLFFGT